MLNNLRVLIAEDEPLLALEYELLLGDRGHIVSGLASRLQDACKLIQGNSFDLAILDLNLSGENAASLSDELRQRNIPFILITAYSDVVDERFSDVPVLTKPVDGNELLETIDTLFLRPQAIACPARA